MIPSTLIWKSEFDRMLSQTARIWDGKEGLSREQAERAGINLEEDIDFIFVRDDGWKIACNQRHFGSTYRLWSDDWVRIYAHTK